MKLADNEEARRETDRILRNWGRWAADDWWKHLNYVRPPANKMYRTPRQEKTKVPQDIDVDCAWTTNETLGLMYKAGLVDEFWLLAAWYAYRKRPQAVADLFEVSLRTIHRHRWLAMQEFHDWRKKVLQCGTGNGTIGYSARSMS